MKKKLKRYIVLHLSLMNCIEKNNCNILNFLENKKLNSAINLIEEKENMVRIVNKFQKDIENIITEANGYYFESIQIWYKTVSQWICNCHLFDRKIIEKLNLAKRSLKEEICEIHTKRMKFQGYNLNQLSK